MKKKKQNILISAAVFAIVFVISIFTIFVMQKHSIETKRSQVENLAVIHGEDIRRTLERSLSVNYTLAALLKYEDGEFKDFSTIAEQLLPYYPGASNLQLAPNGVVTQIIPIEGNEKAIGHDLFHDKERAEEAIAARDSGELTLAGPYRLLQGGMGLIGRLPVYIKSNNSEEFWGFVSVMISLSNLLETLDFNELYDSGYSYQLIKEKAGTEEDFIVAESPATQFHNPTEWSFKIANTKWIFLVEPIKGWANKTVMIAQIIIAFLLSFFAATIVRLILDLRHNKKNMEKMAYTDSLTGLYNRRFFEEELHRIDEEKNLPIAILMGDVNGLKLTNDIFGHAFGDMLLESIAEAMRNICRANDIIARWGGDEFVILLPKTDSDGVEKLAERIKNKVSTQQIGAIRCSISLGYDIKTHYSESITRVLSNAETKMYVVKSLERDGTLSSELDGLINTLFEKSDREKQHAMRVSKLCQKFGRFLGMEESDVNRLTEVGRLHDIGKIVLEPDLLKKDHDFSPTELSEINKHPTTGYRILNSFDNTLELAEVVLAHHEKWDGSGFPKGISGEKIPLLARIISLVEAYDRMIHIPNKTVNKKREEAIREMQSCAGKQFDPKLTEAFVRMLETNNDQN